MRATLGLIAMGLLCAHAHASAEGAIPSCYNAKLGVAPAAVDTELFVLIDQTTLFDKTLQQQLANNIRPFMATDNAYSVLTFSAFSQGRYAQVVTAGTIEAGIPPAVRDDISKALLSKFDACAKRQPQMAMQAAGAAIRGAFAGASADLAKSDVLGSLKSISARIRHSPARHKVVLIASDMLENSSVTSFYANNGTSVRHIDSVKELKLVADEALLADFGGATIHVMGSGLISDAAGTSNRYRDPKTMRALLTFWHAYFQKSNATVAEIGQPALMNPVVRSR